MARKRTRNLTVDEVISQCIADDIAQRNRAFVDQAVKQWDEDGEGCFAEYVRHYSAHCWLEMVRDN